MDISKMNTPDQEVLKEVRMVHSVCSEHDGLKGNLSLDTSINFNPDIPCLFLLYQDGILVSFISMFIPTPAEAEISAYTLPEYRRRGFFKALLQEAAREIKKYNIPELLFVCEPQSKAGMAAVKELNAELDFTEYFLKYSGISGDTEQCNFSGIKLEKADKEDIDSLVSLCCEIFDDSYEVARSMISKTLATDCRLQYKAILEDKLIGMLSVGMENDEACIFGFGVSPKYQGRGFGKEILKLMVNDLRNQGLENITIEVDSSNENAFKLYKKSGFAVEAAFGYYRKPVI